MFDYDLRFIVDMYVIDIAISKNRVLRSVSRCGFYRNEVWLIIYLCVIEAAFLKQSFKVYLQKR